jgi:hypothetical protein
MPICRTERAAKEETSIKQAVKRDLLRPQGGDSVFLQNIV